jgi:hypothetical protein
MAFVPRYPPGTHETIAGGSAAPGKQRRLPTKGVSRRSRSGVLSRTDRTGEGR